jgi:hypothetical protein
VRGDRPEVEAVDDPHQPNPAQHGRRHATEELQQVGVMAEIIVTYAEFYTVPPEIKGVHPAKLDYAEWTRDGKVEYGHATTGGPISTEKGEVEGIPDDVRKALCTLITYG